MNIFVLFRLFFLSWFFSLLLPWFCSFTNNSLYDFLFDAFEDRSTKLKIWIRSLLFLWSRKLILSFFPCHFCIMRFFDRVWSSGIFLYNDISWYRSTILRRVFCERLAYRANSTNLMANARHLYGSVSQYNWVLRVPLGNEWSSDLPYAIPPLPTCKLSSWTQFS